MPVLNQQIKKLKMQMLQHRQQIKKHNKLLVLHKHQLYRQLQQQDLQQKQKLLHL